VHFSKAFVCVRESKDLLKAERLSPTFPSLTQTHHFRQATKRETGNENFYYHYIRATN
jgi:hypothetical protein